MRVLLLLALLCGCDGPRLGPTVYETSILKWSYTKDCIDGWTLYHVDRGVLWAIDPNGNPIPCEAR